MLKKLKIRKMREWLDRFDFLIMHDLIVKFAEEYY
jgi:hypothetical protein